MNDIVIENGIKFHYLDENRNYSTMREVRRAYEYHLMLEIIDIAAILDKLGIETHRVEHGVKKPRFMFIEILRELGFKSYNGSKICYLYFIRLLERISKPEIESMISDKANTYKNDLIVNHLMRQQSEINLY